MLKKTSVTAVELLTTKLAQAGVSLLPMQETPLAALVAKCYDPAIDCRVDGKDTCTIRDEYAFGTVLDLAERTRAITEVDAPDHGNALADFVRVLSGTMQANLHGARNIVNPIIRTVATTVDAARAAAQAPTASPLSIHIVDYKGIWSSPALDNLIDKYKETPAWSEAKLFNLHPLKSKDEVLEMIKTGSGRFDDELAEWVKEVGADFVYDVYRCYFAQGQYIDPEDARNGYPLRYALGYTETDRNRALVIHLIARRLTTDVPEGVDMALPDYRVLMTGVVEQTGRTLCRFYERRQGDIRNKRLILDYPMQGAEYATNSPELAVIRVNGDLYSDWLAAGGTPDAIMGAFVTDRNESQSDILANKERYETAWMRRASLVRSGQRSELFGLTITAYRKAMTDAINALADDQVPHGTRAPLHTRLTTFLNEITASQAERVYDTSKWLVCMVMFPHTDALKILDTLDRTVADNPELAERPMEAALLATIDLLVDWLVRLLTIHKPA